LIGLGLTAVGWQVGKRIPSLTALLIESMPAAVCLAIGAAIGALLIWGSVALIDATGAEPTPRVHAVSDALGALLVLGVAWVGKFGESATPRNFARLYVCRRYQKTFPEQPREAGVELNAYRTVSGACAGEGSWGFRTLKDALNRVRRASS